MAPKKRLPSPPLEDDQPPSTQKQPEDEVAEEEEEEDDSSSEEEEDSSSEEEENDQPKPASKNSPPSTPISNPKPVSESESESGSDSGSDSGSGSESETDSEPEPTPPPNPKVKPLASKPMKAQPKAQSTPVPAKSGTKRPAENENDSNRSKKKTTAAAVAGGASDDENETEEDVKLTGEDSRKTTQRIFNEEDELSILKGLADFISKTGKDPLKDGTAFHSFVKKSLRADANSEQLKRKVRGLKKKFETSDKFAKTHDKKAFELFKKVVWGNNGANEAEENGKVNKGVKKEATVKNGGSVKKEIVKAENDVDKSLVMSEICRFNDAAGLSAFNRDAVISGLELIGESKRVELAERWRQIRIAEMELIVRRSQLAKDQSNWILQALKKSNK